MNLYCVCVLVLVSWVLGAVHMFLKNLSLLLCLLNGLLVYWKEYIEQALLGQFLVLASLVV